ncbi:hypothetical protein [Zooshikella sp. RANM57]|uniref:hypothetical protein n=1 Tax=Zooshikella sp. RANM57 TaxID=3425863 RepID=UPI003D6DE609
MVIKTSRPPKTLSNLKSATHHKGCDGRHYINYFQVGALELERWRREMEREAALKKVAEIDQRLAKINVEINELLEAVDVVPQSKVAKAATTRTAKKKGFNIKY